MQEKKKFVLLRENVHSQVKILAVEEKRRINGDLLDDIVLLGIEAYRNAKKILPVG